MYTGILLRNKFQFFIRIYLQVLGERGAGILFEVRKEKRKTTGTPFITENLESNPRYGIYVYVRVSTVVY